VANNLLKHTQLQINFGVINLCLVEGAPKVLPITALLQDYVDFQISVLTRRTQFFSSGIRSAITSWSASSLATTTSTKSFTSSGTPRPMRNRPAVFNERFGFTEDQTDAILAMTLRRLEGLEQSKLKMSTNELTKNIAEYNRLLSSKDNIVELMIKELSEIKDKFGDKRLTDISDEAANIDNEDLIPQDEIIVVLTKNGYLKRMSDQTFRAQNRGGRGVKGISTTAGDTVNIMLHTKTHTDLLFFTSLGSVYTLRGYMIPDGARDAKGMPAINLLNLDQDEKVISIVPCDDYPESDFLFFATVNGVVKRTKLTEFASIHKNGKRALGLREGDQLLDVKRTNGTAIISLASSNGKVCSFMEDDRPGDGTECGWRERHEPQRWFAPRRHHDFDGRRQDLGFDLA
jgi:DNA gyrase subunit A